MSRRWKIFLLVAFFSILADQATKIWARETLPTNPPGCVLPDAVVAHQCYGEAVPVVDGYWDWRLSFNPGSAFGLFHSQGGARVFLSIVGLFAVGGMGWMVHKAKDHQRALLWALGLVAGGAIGNLIDRIYYGVVTDFVLWHWKTSAEWPVFNVADVVLVVGVGILLFDVGKEPKDKKAGKGAKGDKSAKPETGKADKAETPKADKADAKADKADAKPVDDAKADKAENAKADKADAKPVESAKPVVAAKPDAVVDLTTAESGDSVEA